MPAIVTVSLAQGASRMAKVKVIVKRLVSIEDFGNMDVLCTDKTGTLTEGRIVLKSYASMDDKDDPRILTYAMLCNAAVVGDKISGNPMDAAIWHYAIESGAKDSVANYSKVDEIPFDYQRRMMSAVARNKGGYLFITKGAPESVLSRCTHVEMDGSREAIDESLQLSINDKFLDFSHLGYRIIAVAYKEVDERSSYSAEDEKDLILLGFLTFADPPKDDAQNAVIKLNEMGVDVKILTGDNDW
jgi:Mg2+-importing ATPase